MNINMFDAITAIKEIPEFAPVRNSHASKVMARAKAIRAKCLQLIVGGERNLNALCNKLDVHRTTLLGYLKELDAKGLIEFTTKGGAKIGAVNKGCDNER